MFQLGPGKDLDFLVLTIKCCSTIALGIHMFKIVCPFQLGETIKFRSALNIDELLWMVAKSCTTKRMVDTL